VTSTSGPATDTWALACVLDEMLAGEPPYVASTPQGVLRKIIQGTPTPIAQARPLVPAHVDAAIRRAPEKVPADRFTHVADFAAALADPAFRHGGATADRAAASSASHWGRALARCRWRRSAPSATLADAQPPSRKKRM
jgi:serine/threonine-protein kinase